MAYDVTELWSQKDTAQEQNGWGATRYFSVVGTTAELLDERGVVSASDIPAINSSHPQWRDLRVVNKSAGPGLTERIVSVRYQWLPAGGNPDSGNDDPISWLPEVSWSIAQRSETVDQDIHGKPIANSAGDAFDQLPSVTRFGLNLRITRWETFYDVLKARAFFNKLNKSNVVAGNITFLARTMLCTGIAPAQTFKVGQSPIQVAYDFEIRPTVNSGQPAGVAARPFAFWTLDTGLRGFASGITAPSDFYRLSNGKRVDDAIRLNGNGRPVLYSDFQVYDSTGALASTVNNPTTPGFAIDPVALSGAYALGFDIYEEAEFLGLGL